MFPRPISKLRPLVTCQTQKFAGKVKFGRGFSLAELKEAKLTPAFAQTVGISVDHRRHNKSADMQDANVKRLNDYKAKLILFPKHEGKLKKGEIADSSAEKVKAAAQNKTTGVFGLPAVDKSLEKAALTKEMKAQKTYAKLRQARIDARYNGKRIKAAKEAEEKKKWSPWGRRRLSNEHYALWVYFSNIFVLFYHIAHWILQVLQKW